MRTLLKFLLAILLLTVASVGWAACPSGMTQTYKGCEPKEDAIKTKESKPPSENTASSKIKYCFDPDIGLYYPIDRSFCDAGDVKISKQEFDNKRLSSSSVTTSSSFSTPSTKSTASASYEKGRSYYLQGNYSEAVTWYESAVAQGHAKAQGRLGMLYFEGKGVLKNDNLAFSLLLKAAKQGDPTAQSNVGTFFARGIGTNPNQAESINWYRKSAEQGDSFGQINLAAYYFSGIGTKRDHGKAIEWLRKSLIQAPPRMIDGIKKQAENEKEPFIQFSLGFMFENGLGVQKDFAAAEDWYEKVAQQGVEEATIALARLRATPSSPKKKTTSTTTASSSRKYCYRQSPVRFYTPTDRICKSGDREITKREFDNRRLSESTSATLTAQSTTAPSSEEVTPVPTQTADTSLELEFWQSIKESDDPDMFQAYLEAFPEGTFVPLAKVKLKQLSGTTDVVASAIPDLNYGRYHALVIGNNDYDYLSDLRTAINDAQGIASLLREDYGFEVSLLENATRGNIVKALAGLRKTVGSEDNLLVYYAGHGYLDEAVNEGYWLPVDADREDPSNWLATDRVVAQIRGMQAKHVMVVADSCFSGTIIRAIKIEQRTPDYLQRIVKKKSRTALTSGGLEPVMDSGGGGKYSVFARSLISLLEENTGVLDASQLFSQLRPKVMINSPQTPEYGDIHQAGHDGGDFLFVRQ